jgi:TP901 family phage tail tape measure protein
MALRVAIAITGESASLQRAFAQSASAARLFGKEMESVTVSTTASAEAQVKASVATRARIVEQIGAYRQLAAAAASGSREQVAAANLAAAAQKRLAGSIATTAGEQRLLMSAGARRAARIGAVEGAGRGLTTYVAAPALLAGYEAVKMAHDFEGAMRLIETQAGAPTGEINRLSGGILNLVKSGGSFGQTATSMAKGLFFVESEGIRGAKALEILRVAAAGAAVGQTDLGQTSNALTSVMRVYGLSARDAAPAMATLNAAVGAGKLHMEDLNGALATKFLPTAKQLGISLPQALAALDIFTAAGIPAEVAANNLTTSFIKFLAPTKAGAEALVQLGLTGKQLGDDLQAGGLPKALADLVAGYDKLAASHGKVAANRAVIESFGGSRGGAPVLALIQQHAGYTRILEQTQKNANPATFWKAVAQEMDAPSERMRRDVAKITASLIQLGIVVAPIAADMADMAAKVGAAFGKLPGPVKRDLGLIAGVLGVGGPMLLAGAKVVKMVERIGTAFRLLPVTAGPAIAATDAELATLGGSATVAGGKVSGLRGALLGLKGIGVITIGAELIIHRKEVGGAIGDAVTSVTGSKGLGGAVGSAEKWGISAISGQWGYDLVRKFQAGSKPAPEFTGPKPFPYSPSFDPKKIPHPDKGGGGGAGGGAGGGGLPPIKKFVLPFKLQLEAAKALTESAQLTAARNELAAVNKLIDSGRLSGQALLDAYTERRSLYDTLASAEKAQADKVAARKAKQKAALEKAKQFTVPASLQVAEARADALAVGSDTEGPTKLQIKLARQLKAVTLKAIRSHHLGVQGMIDAWNAYGQAMQTLSQSAKNKGLSGTYHAVSTAALTKSLGLTHDQAVAVQMRAAQRGAHRGHAPSVVAVEGQPIYDLRGSHFHGVQNIDQLAAQLEKKTRQRHQRRGNRS